MQFGTRASPVPSIPFGAGADLRIIAPGAHEGATGPAAAQIVGDRIFVGSFRRSGVEPQVGLFGYGNGVAAAVADGGFGHRQVGRKYAGTGEDAEDAVFCVAPKGPPPALPPPPLPISGDEPEMATYVLTGIPSGSFGLSSSRFSAEMFFSGSFPCANGLEGQNMKVGRKPSAILTFGLGVLALKLPLLATLVQPLKASPWSVIGRIDFHQLGPYGESTGVV